jgi:hypothetical protein
LQLNENGDDAVKSIHIGAVSSQRMRQAYCREMRPKLPVSWSVRQKSFAAASAVLS